MKRQSRLSSWATAGIALAVLCSGGLVHASGGQRAVYKGSMGGASVVKMTVRSPATGGATGTFRASNLRYRCDDGTTRQADLIPIKIKFSGEKRFSGDFYRVGPRDLSQAYIQVKGRLVGGGKRAVGKFLYITDPYDPAAGPENEPECGTFGRIGWSADRR